MISVTRTAIWERVPNGALLKIWGGSSLPNGETMTPPPKKRSREVNYILVTSTDMSSSCKPVAAVKCFYLTDAIPQRIIGQARFILKILLDKIKNNWMQSLCVAGFIEYLLLKFIIEVTCTVEVAPCVDHIS